MDIYGYINIYIYDIYIYIMYIYILCIYIYVLKIINMYLRISKEIPEIQL